MLRKHGLPKQAPGELAIGAEIKTLKNQNKLLAKSLSDSKQRCAQISNERNQLQKELQGATILNNRYSSLVKQMSDLLKVMIRYMCDMSSNTKVMAQCITEAENLHKILDETESTRVSFSFLPSPSPVSQSPSFKTRAVKPMVSGHVIFKPTISLTRVTEPQYESDDINGIMGNRDTVQHFNPDVSDVTVSLSQEDISSFTCQTGNLDGLPAVRTMTVTDQSEQDEHNEIENDSLNLHNRSSSHLGTLVEESDVSDYTNNYEMINGTIKTVQVLLSRLSGELIREKEQSRMLAEEISSQNLEPQDQSYDPLEGPSTLLDKVSKRKQNESGSRKRKQSPSRIKKKSKNEAKTSKQSKELPESSTEENESQARMLRTRRCPSYKEPVLNRKLRRSK